MTDEIPDDVVERALKALKYPEHLEPSPQALRSALRVAVEWEREQCARVADANMCLADADTEFSDGIAYGTKAIAAAIRALKEKQG